MAGEMQLDQDPVADPVFLPFIGQAADPIAQLGLGMPGGKDYSETNEGGRTFSSLGILG